MVEAKPTVENKEARPRPVGAAAMTSKEVFAILRRHILLIVVLTAVGFALGGGTWQVLQRYWPRYTAQTLLEVLPPVETDPMDIVAVQVQKDLQYQHRVSMASLIKQQSMLWNLLQSDKVKETAWWLPYKGKDIRKPFKYLQRHFVAYPQRDAEYVRVSMTCGKASEAALIVREAVSLFYNSQVQSKQVRGGETLAELTKRQDAVQAEVWRANTEMANIRTSSNITDLERPAGRYWRHTFELKLDDLELQQNELLLAIRQTEADMENLKRLAEESPVSVQILHAIEMDPVMIVLAQQLAFQEAQLSGRLSRFGDNHRVVQETQQLIDEIKERRRLRRAEMAEQTRQASYKNAHDRWVVLGQRLNELNNLRDQAAAQKKDLDLARVRYDNELTHRDERLKMLDDIKQQIEKQRIIHDEAPTVRPLLPVPEPLEMVASRQWWVWFPAGTILGLLLSIGLAFLMEMLNDLVRTPTDVGRFLNIPLLGIIPDASEDKQVRGIELWHAVRQAPYSLISESYRRLRTNLELSGLANAAKTLLVTSGDAAEGKTSVAVNLATAFVAQNRKVLLVDANFRQPTLKRIFPRTAANDSKAAGFDFGLSSVLTNQCGYQDVVRHTGIDGFDIIDSGPLPSNPTELLASPRMEELLKEHRKNYDHIVIDSAPVLLVSDAKVLAKIVDATVLVFNAAATRRGAARRTIGELKDVDANVVGCVLFAARALKGGYFHERYKSYQEYLKPQLAGASPA